MLERILGNLWVTIFAFIAGPAVLIWMHVRRRRLESGAKTGAQAATGTTPTAKAPTGTFPTVPDTGAPGARKPLWPGFRGLRWGDPPAEGMALIHEEGETRFLSRTSDEMRVGGVQVGSIVYTFRIHRLEAVVVELPVQGFEPLARYLASEFGAPRSAPDKSKHTWSDAGSGSDGTQAVLEKKPESRSARLVLSSRLGIAARAAKPAGA